MVFRNGASGMWLWWLAGLRKRGLCTGHHLPQRVCIFVLYFEKPLIWHWIFFTNCRWPGGKAEITCTEGRTLDIDYANRRYICRVGDFCPPNMGGVVFGCPALPPPVPENSTGELISPFNIDEILDQICTSRGQLCLHYQWTWRVWRM